MYVSNFSKIQQCIYCRTHVSQTKIAIIIIYMYTLHVVAYDHLKMTMIFSAPREEVFDVLNLFFLISHLMNMSELHTAFQIKFYRRLSNNITYFFKSLILSFYNFIATKIYNKLLVIITFLEILDYIPPTMYNCLISFN